MASISFKDASVKANQIAPEIFHAIVIASDVWEMYGAQELIVTSLRDGSHRQGSYHYTGDAVDIRTKNLPSSAAKRNARDLLAGRLGARFDVILEDLGGPNEHVHIEHDENKP